MSRLHRCNPGVASVVVVAAVVVVIVARCV